MNCTVGCDSICLIRRELVKLLASSWLQRVKQATYHGTLSVVAGLSVVFDLLPRFVVNHIGQFRSDSVNRIVLVARRNGKGLRIVVIACLMLMVGFFAGGRRDLRIAAGGRLRSSHRCLLWLVVLVTLCYGYSLAL